MARETSAMNDNEAVATERLIINREAQQKITEICVNALDRKAEREARDEQPEIKPYAQLIIAEICLKALERKRAREAQVKDNNGSNVEKRRF